METSISVKIFFWTAKARNTVIASKKTNVGILFLYKIIKGVARQSFGLEVAKLAKLPEPLLLRAAQLLHQFEHKDSDLSQLSFLPVQKKLLPDTQWAEKYHRLATKHDQQKALIERMQNIDCDNLSPKQAFDLLWTLQQEIKSL